LGADEVCGWSICERHQGEVGVGHPDARVTAVPADSRRSEHSQLRGGPGCGTRFEHRVFAYRRDGDASQSCSGGASDAASCVLPT
jgi:hypothetical protein